MSARVPTFGRHHAQPLRSHPLAHPCRRRFCGAQPTRPAPDLPRRRNGELHRRLRASARRRSAPGQRHPCGAARARGGRGARHGEVLDDVRECRLHALPVRRQRHDLPLHPPQQRSDRAQRQPGIMRCRHCLRTGTEERRARCGGTTRRLRWRFRRRGRDPPASSFRAASERRRGGQSLSVPPQGAAAHLLREARLEGLAQRCRDDPLRARRR